VLIAESSMKSKIRINDYNDFRKYNVGRVVFDTSLLGGNIQHLLHCSWMSSLDRLTYRCKESFLREMMTLKCHQPAA
jgi:hypothetical protein